MCMGKEPEQPNIDPKNQAMFLQAQAYNMNLKNNINKFSQINYNNMAFNQTLDSLKNYYNSNIELQNQYLNASSNTKKNMNSFDSYKNAINYKNQEIFAQYCKEQALINQWLGMFGNNNSNLVANNLPNNLPNNLHQENLTKDIEVQKNLEMQNICMEQSIMNNMNVDLNRTNYNNSNNQISLNQNIMNNQNHCEQGNSLPKQSIQNSDKINNKSLYDPFTGAILKGGNTKKRQKNFGNNMDNTQRSVNCNFNTPNDMKYSKFFKGSRTNNQEFSSINLLDLNKFLDN